jgi:hypothetical protein
MQEIKNINSIVFSGNNDQILTYIDYDGIINENSINEFVSNKANNFNILKKKIIMENNKYYFSDIDNFNIKDYYKIKYIDHDKFDKCINRLLNKSFVTEARWFFYFCIDKKNGKSRVYFKISHAYADGYKIIEILTTKNLTENLNKPTKQINIYSRTYHILIGTIILLLSNLYLFFKSIWSYFSCKSIQPNSQFNKEQKYKSQYLKVQPLNIYKIKTFCKRNNVSVNDFLYTLMIRSHSLYTNKETNITTVSPINISKNKYENNMCPLLLDIDNSLDTKILLHNVTSKFNHCKYSLFIPIISYIQDMISNICNCSTLSYIYEIIMKNGYDLIYSNIIGPSTEDTDILGIGPASDIHFVLNSSGITYNIISYDDHINITISFKTGNILNKRHYKNCVFDAYNELLRF